MWRRIGKYERNLLELFQVVLLLFIYGKSPLHHCTISGTIFFGCCPITKKSNTKCKFQWRQQQIHLEVTRFFSTQLRHPYIGVTKTVMFASTMGVLQAAERLNKRSPFHSCHSWTSLEVRIEVTLTAVNRHNLFVYRYLKFFFKVFV